MVMLTIPSTKLASSSELRLRFWVTIVANERKTASGEFFVHGTVY